MFVLQYSINGDGGLTQAESKKDEERKKSPMLPRRTGQGQQKSNEREEEEAKEDRSVSSETADDGCDHSRRSEDAVARAGTAVCRVVSAMTSMRMMAPTRRSRRESSEDGDGKEEADVARGIHCLA
mmetsp:Transcript_20849/g.49343  ORF Transcript_20849/g.49343 Transcript_20849/m.49343 type:complete len:126 (-) Transcript_20849:345-722(-)